MPTNMLQTYQPMQQQDLKPQVQTNTNATLQDFGNEMMLSAPMNTFLPRQTENPYTVITKNSKPLKTLAPQIKMDNINPQIFGKGYETVFTNYSVGNLGNSAIFPVENRIGRKQIP